MDDEFVEGITGLFFELFGTHQHATLAIMGLTLLVTLKLSVKSIGFTRRAVSSALGIAAVIYVVMAHEAGVPGLTETPAWQWILLLFGGVMAWRSRRRIPFVGIHADGMSLYRHTESDREQLKAAGPRRMGKAPVLIAMIIMVLLVWLQPDDLGYAQYLAGGLLVLVLGHSVVSLLVEFYRYPQVPITSLRVKLITARMNRDMTPKGALTA